MSGGRAEKVKYLDFPEIMKLRRQLRTVRDIAELYHVAHDTMRKLLKKLFSVAEYNAIADSVRCEAQSRRNYAYERAHPKKKRERKREPEEKVIVVKESVCWHCYACGEDYFGARPIVCVKCSPTNSRFEKIERVAM